MSDKAQAAKRRARASSVPPKGKGHEPDLRVAVNPLEGDGAHRPITRSRGRTLHLDSEESSKTGDNISAGSSESHVNDMPSLASEGASGSGDSEVDFTRGFEDTPLFRTTRVVENREAQDLRVQDLNAGAEEPEGPTEHVRERTPQPERLKRAVERLKESRALRSVRETAPEPVLPRNSPLRRQGIVQASSFDLSVGEAGGVAKRYVTQTNASLRAMCKAPELEEEDIPTWEFVQNTQ